MTRDCLILPIDIVAMYIYFRLLARGGWKSSPGQLQKNKMNVSILRQEKLIAEKKKEIEARLAEKAKMSEQTMSKPQPPR